MYINEIFGSIDGEVNPWLQGRLSYFIRFQGCNLKCPYCDAKSSQSIGGLEMSFKQILSSIPSNYRKITLTGGEPLLQPGIKDFISVLLQLDYLVSVETNGTIVCDMEHENLAFIIDIKLPSSQVLENLIKFDWIKTKLQSSNNNYLKFGIQSFPDFLKALEYVDKFGYIKSRIAFSPIMLPDNKELFKNQVETLVSWMKKYDFMESILNLQLHKFIDFR